VGKLVRVVEGGKLHRRGGKTHLPRASQLAGAAAHAQQSGVGKLVKAAVGGKLHRKGGKPTSHVNCK
jgi:hypothetical protein